MAGSGLIRLCDGTHLVVELKKLLVTKQTYAPCEFSATDLYYSSAGGNSPLRAVLQREMLDVNLLIVNGMWFCKNWHH